VRVCTCVWWLCVCGSVSVCVCVCICMYYDLDNLSVKASVCVGVFDLSAKWCRELSGAKWCV